MKTIGILLLIVGTIGLVFSLFMFGDIAIAGSIGSVTALLSGIGFIIGPREKNKTAV